VPVYFSTTVDNNLNLDLLPQNALKLLEVTVTVLQEPATLAAILGVRSVE